jgi:hypothetical protein
MVCRGLAAGARGVKKKRNAVGPSEGNTNGVPDAIATAARTAIVTKPFRNMNRAQIGRSE